MLFRVSIFFMLASMILIPALPPSSVKAQSGGTSVLYVSPPTSYLNKSFPIRVALNLTSNQAFNAYDIHLSYYYIVLNATGLVAAPGAQELSHCVNGSGTGCDINDQTGVVHSAASFPTIVYGPRSNFTLFTVQFSIVGKGTSLLHPFNDTLVNPNQGNTPQAIIHVTEDGIFSNTGIVALFNVAPAILIVNQPVFFDGTASFNPNGTKIASYSWDFGDGGTGGKGPLVSHNYTSVGNPSVKLTVTDVNGKIGSITKTIAVGSGLGQIKISIKSSTGGDVITAVTVSLYNGTVFVENRTKPPFTTGVLSFSNLVPGVYRLDFHGTGIISSSMQETVIPGWTTFDTAFLTLVKPPATNPPDLTFFYYLLGVFCGGVALAAVAVFRKRSENKSTRTNRTQGR